MRLIPLMFSVFAQVIIAGADDYPASRTIRLYPCDNNYFRIDFDYRFDKAPGPFKQESGFESKDVRRGFIPTVPPTPFIRDLSEQELCLNHDRTGSFADDSVRRYPSAHDASGHVIFRNIPVAAFNGRMEIPYLIDLNTYETACSGWIIVRSGWKGFLDIDGAPWQLCITDNLDGQIDSQDTFSIRKANGREYRLVPNIHSVPPTLFVDGHAFELTFEFAQQNQDVILEAAVTEIYPPLGIVDIRAEGCDTVFLQNANTAVVLHSPGGQTRLPAGRYHLTECILKADSPLTGIAAFSYFDRDLLVETNQQTVLRIGLPLEHHVEIARNKDLLNLTYKLQGQGGEVYTSYSGQPWFAVYKGPVRIGGGQFAYG